MCFLIIFHISVQTPYYLVVYIKWWVVWVWRFDINKEEYGPEEKLYLTRKKLKLSTEQWQVCMYEQW
jgi:DnaJ family protein C protein 25